MYALEAKTRIALKNILFATDFSPVADAAAPFAIQIARRYGARVFGLHVNKFDDYTAAVPDAWAAMLDYAEKEAKEDACHLDEQLRGITHEVVIEKGKIWDVMSRLINEKGIDLVVLGTHGRTGLAKALLGSVAEEILRNSPRPVLTVGPHVDVRPDEAMKMREIVYATDLAEELPVAASYAVSLAEENEANLTLLNVIEDPVEKGRNAEAVKFKMRRLRDLVPLGADLWFQPAYRVEQGVAADKVLEIAQIKRADLIVLGARPAKGLTTHLDAGTVHKVVSQARCPVLTVRG